MSLARDQNEAEAIAVAQPLQMSSVPFYTWWDPHPTRYKKALKTSPPGRPVTRVMQL
jgi:hypothetical protein